ACPLRCVARGTAGRLQIGGALKTVTFASALFALVLVSSAQTPPPAQQGGATPPTTTPAAQPPRQGGGGRGGVVVLTLSTPAWIDGAVMPLAYTQAGEEVSPPLTWTDPPATTTSFALIVH